MHYFHKIKKDNEIMLRIEKRFQNSFGMSISNEF